MPSSSSSSSSEETSSANDESSSDSGNTDKLSTLPLIRKSQKKSSPNNVLTPSKPSSSIKRLREPQRKEVSKQSSKKSKKPAQEDNKGKAAEGSEAEKSTKKNGTIWNAKDEAAFMERLVAVYEKGKTLPKNLSVFYEVVKNDLDGDYSNDQLYNKARTLKTKFGLARGKIKNGGFVGFKNPHEERMYIMSKQVWGNTEEEEGCSEKVGEGDNARGEKKKNVVEDNARREEKKNVGEDNARGEKKKKKNTVDKVREREELKVNKSEDVGMALKEQEDEAEEEENKDTGEGEGHDEDEQNINVNLSQQDALKEVNIRKTNEDEDNSRGEEKKKGVNIRKRNKDEDNGRGEEKKNVGEDNARGEKKKKKKMKNAVDEAGEREELKMNKSEDVGMALKEQEEEAKEEENRDAEEGEGHDEEEQNINVNLLQQDALKEVSIRKRNEDVPSHIAGIVTRRSEVKKGEKEVSSDEDRGEEQDSSDEDEESENELTDNENSALPHSNAAVEPSRSNIGGSSTLRNLKSALKQTTGRENLTNNVSNGVLKGSTRVGTAGHYNAGKNSRQRVVERLSEGRKVAADGHHDAAENLAQPVPNNTANGNHGMTDQHQLFDQLCKDSSRIFQSQRKNMLDELKNEILNISDMVKKDLQASSCSARPTCFDCTRTRVFSFGRELPPLSKAEIEMIDLKWQRQQLIEMEATSKRFALLIEEYTLRMAKVNDMLSDGN